MMTDTVDVVIVGGGGSGLAAAVSAAEHGAQVLVLERHATLGGTTSLAVGLISAAGTRLQRQAGIQDDWRDFVADMALFTGDLLDADNAVLREWLARHAADTIDWLADWGVVFAGPFPEPPHRVCRMHNAMPGAAAITRRLMLACRRLGVRAVTQAEVLSLRSDACGRVTGVICEVNGEQREIQARCGVILASGDFSGNASMRQEHLNPAAARALPINPLNQGRMFELARELGAQYTHMSHIFGPQLRFSQGPQKGLAERMPSWPWLCRLSQWFFQHAPDILKKTLIKPLLMNHMSPSEVLFQQGAVLVDRRGRMLDTRQPAVAVAMTEERQAFIILPDQVALLFHGRPHHVSTAPGIAYAHLGDYRKGRPDLVHEAATLHDLAELLGLTETASLQAVFSPTPAGPWVALGPVQAMLTTTEGALVTTVGGQTSNTRGEAIEGLFAVGCVGQGGLLLRGHGLHLAWALTSGRITGQMVAGLNQGVKNAKRA